MPQESRDAWLFSLKAYAAAMLAFYIALAAGLDRPAWAVTTVYVVSQPFSAATASKSGYRLAGTMLGAAAAVLFVPVFVQTPPLLCIVLALWVAACLYVSLQNRSPSSYVAMLAGYTVAFIAFPSVSTPQAIFPIAVSRVEEIAVAVICSALLHSLVFPRSLEAMIRDRFERWRVDSRKWVGEAIQGMLRGETTVSSVDPASLARYPLELDAILHNLAYEASRWRLAGQALGTLQDAQARVLPIVNAIQGRAHLLVQLGVRYSDYPPAVQVLTKQLADHLAGRPDALPLPELTAIASRMRWTTQGEDVWVEWMVTGLIDRLHELIVALHACDAGWVHLALANAERITTENKRMITNPKQSFRRVLRTQMLRARSGRHIDHGLVLLSCGTAVIAILLGCAVWMATGWGDGASVPMIAAVACSFFASQDTPLPSMRKFARYSVLAVIVFLSYGVCILPQAVTFESLVLFLAPTFLVLGRLIAEPSQNFLGMVIATNVATMMALDNRFDVNVASSMNAGLALVVGIALTAVVMGLIRAQRVLGCKADRTRGNGRPRSACVGDRANCVLPHRPNPARPLLPCRHSTFVLCCSSAPARNGGCHLAPIASRC